MSTSAWTTWPSIHPLLWLLLSAIVRIIIEVRQLAKYLGLEDPTCTLLLEHPNKTSSYILKTLEDSSSVGEQSTMDHSWFLSWGIG